MELIRFADVDIEVVRSRRRSIGLEVRPDGRVILRMPNRLPKRDALAFLQSKEAWLRKAVAQVEARESFAEAAGLEPLTEEELSALTKAARAYFTEKCAWLAPVVGVDYGRISIRHQKTRWGSCSSKGNLNFNCLMMLAPEDVRDYVVVHELCHLWVSGHSKAFWAHVEHACPDWRRIRKQLRGN